MYAIPSGQQTNRNGTTSGLQASTMDLLQRNIWRNSNIIKKKLRQVPICRRNIVSSFCVNFRENQQAFFTFLLTLYSDRGHNKNIDFTRLSRLFLYLLVFANFRKNRFESGQRHKGSLVYRGSFFLYLNEQAIYRVLWKVYKILFYFTERTLNIYYKNGMVHDINDFGGN